jgi:hypothetical protein
MSPRAPIFVGLVFTLGGCAAGRCADDTPGALAWTTIAPDAIESAPSAHVIRFGIDLPASARPARRLVLCFAHPLDGAEVETFGTGPRHWLTELDERRVSGAALAVELPPLAFRRLDVVVHHHLRPVPLPPHVRIGAEVRP